MAEKGKLKQIVERSGVVPNGTPFAITTGPAPELDDINLVVGKVVDGLDVVKDIETLPVVRDNSKSFWFKAGKQIGDTRATVAELAFNRPFNKVTVLSSGLL